MSSYKRLNKTPNELSPTLAAPRFHVRVFIKEEFEIRQDALGMVPVIATTHSTGLTGKQTASS